jgi:hypothetical protein
MVRNQVALLCTALLLGSSSASANGACQVAAAPPQGVKEQFTQIPAGSVVEVKLADKHKIRGRLGSITDSGFDLQFTKAGKIVTDTLAFDNVRSVKVVGQGWSTGKKIVVGTLIGAGAIFIIGLIACLAGGCGPMVR